LSEIFGKMDIVWLSANRLGYELLKEATNLKDQDIQAIITLSDKSKTVMYDAIEKERWHDFGIEVLEIDNLNEEKNLLNSISPDLVIMCGWRQIINKDILSIPKKGFVGFHPTLLPKGRGSAPIINSILNDIKESGITMFYVTECLDDGDIICQERFNIDESDHAEDVYNKVIKAGRRLIKTYLPLITQGKAPRMPQDNSKATFFERLRLEDNEIDLEKESIDEIYRKIKALSKPYMGAYIKKNGKKLIIWRAGLEE
jgi:methionyl-tRNA formyltransferase